MVYNLIDHSLREMSTQQLRLKLFLPSELQYPEWVPIFISFIVALDPLDKLYKSGREQRHDDRSIRGQRSRALYQTDNKWNDINIYGLLDESGNLKVTTTHLS